MIDKLLFLILMTLTYLPVFAQQNDGTGQSNSHIYGDGFNARVREIPYTPGETRGSYYLFENWSPGTITMRNGEEVRDIFLKYNFDKELLDIKTDSAYYALSAADTKRFTIYDDEQKAFRHFVAAIDYKIEGTPLAGALEVLYEDRISLMSRTDPKLIEANYKGALSGGAKSDKIVKEKEYLLADQGQIVILPTKKKEAIQVLKAYDTSVDRFIKKNRIKTKHQEDLIRVVEHLNQQKR